MCPARSIGELSDPEFAELDQLYWITNRADLRTRCQIILLCHEGYSVPDIAKLVRLSKDTVLYWLGRYNADGITGLWT